MAQQHVIVHEPAGLGGDTEQQDADGGEFAAQGAIEAVERRHGHGCTLQAGGPHAADDDRQGHDGADDHGVDEHLEHAPQALPDGMLHVRLGVDHGGGALSGLVGEHRTGDAVLDGSPEGRAGETAHSRGSIESAVKDQGQGGGQLPDVGDDHAQSADDEEDDHDGHDFAGKFHNPFAAAPDDDPDHDAVDHAKDHDVDVEAGGETFGNGVALDAREEVTGEADAESGRQHGGDLLQLAGQQLPQAPLDIIGRAAIGLSVLVLGAVVDRQGDLGAFQTHAQQGGHPQPEDGARAADGDGGGHAADVGHAHAAADGGGNRLVGAHMAGAGVVFPLVKQRAERLFAEMSKVPELKQAGPHRKDEAGAQHQYQQWGSPEDIHRFFKKCYKSHNFPSLFTVTHWVVCGVDSAGPKKLMRGKCFT